jgi:pimeloyl-ACP methyl ester carboxylesterase
VLRHRFASVAVAAAAAGLLLAGTDPAGATTANTSYPVAPNIAAGIAAALTDPSQPPPGANLASCSLTAAHPYPVVLVNGTFANAEDDFAALAPTLANAGYCVYTFNYGGTPGAFIQSTGPVTTSAQQVAAYVDQVRTATGAAKVDLVGHSQGGMLAEYYTKVLGGASKVHSVVALSPTTHGTTLDGLATLARFIPGANGLVGAACPACADQETGSAVINRLDAGPIAQPGVGYTVIETLNETVVTPVGSSFINEAGVTNRYVQSQCPLDTVDHADLPYDQVVLQDVKNALSPSTAQSPNCLHAFPYPA